MTSPTGYVLSRFPALSHTFIHREIEALRARGLEIHTATVRPGLGDDLLEPANRSAAESTYVVLCSSRARLAARIAVVFCAHPSAVLSLVVSSLRRSPPGVRASVWRIFYALEALIVWRWARDRGVRHLHAHFTNVASDLAELAAEFGGRVGSGPTSWSMTVHGSLDFFEVTQHRFPGKVASASSVAVISAFTRAMVWFHSATEDWRKVHVVRCGLRLRDHPLLERSDDPEWTVLTAARLDAGKGIDLLIDAIATIRQARGRGRLVVAGEGPHRSALEQHVRDLGLDEDAVHFVGAVDQAALRRLHADAAVFCLPSFSEGIPVVLMEAMAYGTPVVATRIMGVPELIEEDVGGLLVRPTDGEELVQALLDTFVDPAAARVRAAAGRARIEAEYDVEVNVQDLVQVVQPTAGARVPNVVSAR